MLNKIILKLNHWRNKFPFNFIKTKHHKRYLKWINNKDHLNLRIRYDIDENSVVFDLGGYLGEWTDSIYTMYNSNVYVFEPNNILYSFLKNKYKNNNKIKVFDFGLSKGDKIEKLYLNNDSSSTLKKLNSKVIDIKILDFLNFIKENNISKIDLIKINIEGGEYELLEYLIENPFINKIKNLQIQFHDFFKDAERRMIYIQNKLSKTHYLTYQFYFIWENWRLKE